MLKKQQNSDECIEPTAPPLYEWETIQMEDVQKMEVEYIKTMVDRVLRLENIIPTIDMYLEYNGIVIHIEKHQKRTMLDRVKDVLEIVIDHPIKFLGLLTLLKFK